MQKTDVTGEDSANGMSGVSMTSEVKDERTPKPSKNAAMKDSVSLSSNSYSQSHGH